jgi:hypothetical protein
MNAGKATSIESKPEVRSDSFSAMASASISRTGRLSFFPPATVFCLIGQELENP